MLWSDGTLDIFIPMSSITKGSLWGLLTVAEPVVTGFRGYENYRTQFEAHVRVGMSSVTKGLQKRWMPCMNSLGSTNMIYVSLVIYSIHNNTRHTSSLWPMSIWRASCRRFSPWWVERCRRQRYPWASCREVQWCSYDDSGRWTGSTSGSKPTWIQNEALIESTTNEKSCFLILTVDSW